MGERFSDGTLQEVWRIAYGKGTTRLEFPLNQRLELSSIERFNWRAEGWDSVCAGDGKIGAANGDIRMVEQVEGLEPELQFGSVMVCHEGFHDANIAAYVGGCGKGIAADSNGASADRVSSRSIDVCGH